MPRRGRSCTQFYIDMLIDGRATGLPFHRELVDDLYADPQALVREVLQYRLALPA